MRITINEFIVNYDHVSFRIPYQVAPAPLTGFLIHAEQYSGGPTLGGASLNRDLDSAHVAPSTQYLVGFIFFTNKVLLRYLYTRTVHSTAKVGIAPLRSYIYGWGRERFPVAANAN